ncbi:MAG: GNAT family N-acetyltransferase [Bacteroidota bacterium]|jgi:GNAT superfamily N-acetyltransferase
MTADARWFTVRWLIIADMPKVMEILEGNGISISEIEIRAMLRQRNVIGMVAECSGLVSGVVIYALEKQAIDIHLLAVDPGQQWTGIGRGMIDKLKSKLTGSRRNLFATVSEYDVAAQMFSRAMGFRAVETLRDWDDQGDGILFQYVRG